MGRESGPGALARAVVARCPGRVGGVCGLAYHGLMIACEPKSVRVGVVRRRLGVALVVTVVFLACAGQGATPPHAPTPVAPGRTVAIMAINDVYRIGGVQGGAVGGLARVRSLRRELERGYPELLMLHAGDFLYPSLLSSSYDGAQMIDVMNQLDGADGVLDERMVVTFGNHEFDKGRLEAASRLAQRVADSEFRWLASNIEFVADSEGQPVIGGSALVNQVLVESGGVTVGLFSLTIDEQRPEYVARFAPAETVARQACAALRSAGAEVVVALTHLRLSQDLDLLDKLGNAGPDLVIGGHEHNQIAEQRDGRWVLKADADAVSATVALVTVAPDGGIEVDHRFHDLGPEMPPDPVLAARVDDWYRRHDALYCAGLDPAREPGCLNDVIGTTRVRLVAEELEIRRHETNMGNWVADQARLAFADKGAQIAFVNSGALRLNQDLKPGSITLRNLEELFPFSTQLVLLRVSGAVLRAAVKHAVQDWTGNGWFVQVSGFAFRHDPQTETVDGLVMLTPTGPRPIADDEMLLLVTSDFLIDPDRGQDGYTMLHPDQQVAGISRRSLRAAVVAALKASGEEGIAPRVEGRICNALVGGPCLTDR